VSCLYYAILLVAVVLIFVTFSVSIFGPTSRTAKERHEEFLSRQTPEKVIMEMVEVKDLVHESIMHRTIRDCLPSQNKKCMTFVPQPLQKDAELVQRIALVVPTGRLASVVYSQMHLVADGFNRQLSRPEPKIEIIATSHVPPYGYGKSHGLTRIVKLMPQPILLQVTDALQGVLGPEQSTRSITFVDLQVGLLQVMRMHCRLSHVAAHTASLTIDTKTLVNATELSLALHNFMTSTGGTTTGGGEGMPVTVDDDKINIFYNQASVGAGLLTRFSEMMPDGTDVLTILDRVLQNELERTKNMSVWPCPSFWEAPPPLALSALTRRLAKALSPDCDDPYVSCFVKRDQCEAVGDPFCKKK